MIRDEEGEPTPLELYAEQIAEDVIKAFQAWIRPELAKIIGWPAVNGIKDQDFESVLQAQYKMLSIDSGHTARKDGATFSFKLYQGTPQKHKVLSKFKYEVRFEDYKERETDGK